MKRIIWPTAFCLLSFSALFALRAFDSHFLDVNGLKYLRAFCYACLAIVVVKSGAYLLFDILYFKRTKRKAPELLRIIFSLVAYAILVPSICGLVLGYNFTGLIATSAVLSVVVGLALQDTLGNFFAGASLQIEQPFKIKDSLKFRDHKGEVEGISWRATTIRTDNNTLLKIPNALMAHEPIEIIPYSCLHRHSVGFSAPYSVSPQTVINIAKNAAIFMPDISDEMDPIVRITGFGESSVNYETLFWTTNYAKVGEISAGLRERIWYAFYRDNVRIPFPTRHILLDRMKNLPLQCVSQIDYSCVMEQIDVFEPLSAIEKEALLTSNAVKVYGPGEFIVRCGEAGDSMFIIGRGRAEVRTRSDSKPSSIAVLETGSFFGEMSLLSGEARLADVVATNEVEVIEISKGSLQKLLIGNARLAEAFSEKASERLAVLKTHTDSIGHEDIQEEKGKLLERIRKFFSLY